MSQFVESRVGDFLGLPAKTALPPRHAAVAESAPPPRVEIAAPAPAPASQPSASPAAAEERRESPPRPKMSADQIFTF